MSPSPSPTRSIAHRRPESANPSGGRRPASPTPNPSTSPRFAPYNVPSSPAASLKDLPPHEIKRLNQFLRHHTIRMAAEYLASYRLKAAIEQGILPPPPKKTLPAARYTPCMDLVDDPDSPTVMAVFEVPGCNANDLTVRIQDSKLLVHGERRPTFPQPAHKTLTDNTQSAASHSAADDDSNDRRPVIQHREVRFGTFFRDINVPIGTKQSDITARLENGMLTVTWPRQPHQQSSHTTTMAKLHTAMPPMIAPSA